MSGGEEPGTERPLALMPLKALLAELFARADVGLVALLVDRGNGTTMEHAYSHGSLRTVQGLAMGLIARVETRIQAGKTGEDGDD